jgi:hypothetical protein
LIGREEEEKKEGERGEEERGEEIKCFTKTDPTVDRKKEDLQLPAKERDIY